MGIKRKLFPGNTADIPALESWLEDLAQEGLFPLSFNGYYAKFREGKPQKMAYRIEVPKYYQAEPPKAMRETYEEFGWQFVCSMWQYYLFASAEECPIEPHTDPLVQAELLEDAHRDSKQAFLAGCGVFFVFLILCALMTWAQLDAFLRGFSLLHCLLVMFTFSFGIGWDASRMRTQSRLRRRLAAGVPMEHRKDYRRALRVQPMLVLLILLMCFTPLLSATASILNRPREYVSSELPSPLPCLPLAEVEGTEGETPASVTFGKSLFAPVQYTIRESGKDSYLQTTYLEVRPEPLAAQAMKTLADNGRYFMNSALKRREIEVEPGLFDGIEYYHSDGRTIFAARKGNAIIKVEYRGSADISAHLPAYAALLEERYPAPAR